MVGFLSIWGLENLSIRLALLMDRIHSVLILSGCELRVRAKPYKSTGGAVSFSFLAVKSCWLCPCSLSAFSNLEKHCLRSEYCDDSTDERIV